MGKLISGVLGISLLLLFGSLISSPGTDDSVIPCPDIAVWDTSVSLPNNSSHNVVLHDYTSIGDTSIYYILGGYMNDTITSEVLRFQSGSNTYSSTLIPNLPARLSNGFGFTLGDSLYYGGGYTPGWEAQVSPVIDSLFDVTYSSATNGYIGTTLARILQTTNNGGTWSTVILDSTIRKVRSIKFTSPIRGWALTSSDTSRIYRTTNGTSWTPASPILANLNKLDFGDSLTGWAGGNSNRVYRTSDGGVTWGLSATGFFANINCVSASGTTHMWGACDSGKVLRTTNGGVVWSEVAISASKLNTIKFINSSTGFAGGEGGVFYRTTNSGGAWTQISLGTILPINDIENPSGGVILVSGDNGNIFVSPNSGTSWTKKRGVTNTDIRAIAGEGGSGLGTIIGSAGFITHSTSGYFDGVISKRLYKLNLNSPGGGWVERDSIPVPIAEVFSNAEELNDSLAYIVGGKTDFNITLNSTYRYNGRTDDWTTATPLPDSLSEGGIGFISDTTLFFVGGKNNTGISGVVYRGLIKISAGQPDSITWTADTTYPGGALFGMGSAGIKSLGVGLIVGGSSNVFPEYPTTTSYLITNDELCAVPLTVLRIARPAVTTGTDGCDLGFSSETLRGTDTLMYTFHSFGGIEDSLSTSNSVHRVLNVIDYVISVQSISNEIPLNFELKQNYPNPFNPATSIIYNLPKKENVALKIYDITGRLVSVVVNTIQEPGTYMVRYSNPALASGIYIYSIEAGSFKSAKYMVLLK